jgi:hypothetical protein
MPRADLAVAKLRGGLPTTTGITAVHRGPKPEEAARRSVKIQKTVLELIRAQRRREKA